MLARRHAHKPVPANNARQPTTATTGIMLAVLGKDARALCAGCRVVATGLASSCEASGHWADACLKSSVNLGLKGLTVPPQIATPIPIRQAA
jgi:hypothetical protein